MYSVRRRKSATASPVRMVLVELIISRRVRIIMLRALVKAPTMQIITARYPCTACVGERVDL